MIKEIYTAALGMQSQITRLEVTANNIANSTTPGYKRVSIFEQGLIEATNNLSNIEGDVEQNDPPVGSYFDFSGGEMQRTANPLDLAIEGNGFFTLTDEEGKEYLTRAGNFQLSDDGTIISMDRKKLMGIDGPLSINKEFMSRSSVNEGSNSRNVWVTNSGEVFVNETEIGKISIKVPNDMKVLQRVSASQFTKPEDSELVEVEADKVNIRQGWLEGSNVNIVKEMVQMIELQRIYDAGSKVIQLNDQTLEKSISTGRFM